MTATAEPFGAAELLGLEQVGELRFRSTHSLHNGRGAIFGGQPLVQGLAAAGRTVPGWPAHNLSSIFLRPGAPEQLVDYAVEAVRDGRRFAARRVLASQAGKPIFDMLCSFHDPEEGPAHQFGERPASPPPGNLPSVAEFVAANAGRLPRGLVETYTRPFPIELRVPDPESVFFAPAATPERNYWLRMKSATGVSGVLDHQCLIAFMSDYWLAGTPGAMHVRPSNAGGVAVVTLDHSLWFHAPVRADEWTMFQTDSPWSGQGRGLARGLIYNEAGLLVATVVQEISMRAMAPR